MAIYIVDDMNTISHLFHGWDETFIWSCLQGCMGIAYADSLHNPLSAQISLGDFLFFAGEMNYDLVGNKPTNLHSDFAIMVPQNQQWEEAIEHYYKEKAVRYIRYATKKVICGAIYKYGFFLLSKRLKKWYNPCMRELDTLKT